MFADFLMKILKWYPADRPSAQEMLNHPWLTMKDDYHYKMTEMELKLYELKDQAKQVDNFEVELNILQENKANLLNPNSQHQMTLDFN